MSTINRRASKRRRRRPPLAFHTPTACEERLLHQAIQNSKLDRARPKDAKLDIPWGPTFYPTVEEMEGNPLHFVDKIRPIAQRYGICKIVPPKGWNPPSSNCRGRNPDFKFSTKHQLLHRLQEGISFGDGDEYNAVDYQRMATKRAKEWKDRYYPDHDHLASSSSSNSTTGVGGAGDEAAGGTSDLNDTNDSDSIDRRRFRPENLERDYWDVVETRSREVAVEYGNDIDTHEFGSGFPISERGRSVYATRDPEKMKLPEPKFGTEDYYKETWWNINNMPLAPDSVLRHVKVGITGINVPWLYYGSLFSTFCWHNEDNYLYSVNYHHRGAPKQWYGVPGTKKDADGLEKVFKNYLSMKMRDTPDLLHHITTMFSPRLLQNADVPVYKLLQQEGEYIVTFPRAFHGGFCMGPNIGEAVNFATHDWIAYGADASERYRSFARSAVFSHDRLTFTMANHIMDQKAYSTCKLLLEELERVVSEELQLRKKLIHLGVRDVSDMISLPRNILDQLDEESADYDDKRLCHACKHVCFFSAVACECSQSKVSCLRHSHYMCRCPTERKYLMIWSGEKELNGTLQKVRSHCKNLQNSNMRPTKRTTSTSTSTADSSDDEKVSTDDFVKAGLDLLPPVAPGSERDLAMHKDKEIPLDVFSRCSKHIGITSTTVATEVLSCSIDLKKQRQDSTMSVPELMNTPGSSPSPPLTTSSASDNVQDVTVIENTEDDREVEIVAVRQT